jgi:dTDP-4-dehydrorhamnose 3,5-epimerase
VRFHPTTLKDAFIVDLEAVEDERGLFGRTFCAREFGQQGLADSFVQCSVSWNKLKGTLRGLHYQRQPAGEVKLVRCTAGAVWDVIVDVRPESPTYLRHIGVELSAANRRALYIPEMFAHGFQTLADGSEVFYQMNAFYAPEFAMGLLYNDPKLGVEWPMEPTVMSDKDRAWVRLP